MSNLIRETTNIFGGPTITGKEGTTWTTRGIGRTTQPLFLINIHPLLNPPPAPEKSLCIPYKLRLGFILTVNLYVTHDRPRSHQDPQIPYVFSGKIRLAFNVAVNLYDARPTAPGFRIFFQAKPAPQKPFQIPCAFSMKVRLAFNVIANLYVTRSTAPTFLVFFRRKCT